jgi:glutamate-1-semialdehyde 2,1-aminomutase
LYFANEVPASFEAVTKSNIETFKKFFHLMLDEGVYFAPSAYEAGFTSIAHDNAVLEEIIASARTSFKKL